MGENKKVRRIFFCSALLVLLFYFVFSLSNISALGISPGKIIINFSSGLEKTLDFSAVNHENNSVELTPYTGGELAQYISCSKEPLKVDANSMKQFSCKLIFPQKIEAGEYEGRVGLSETSSGDNNINVILSVESRILVSVSEKEEDKMKEGYGWIVLFALLLIIFFIIVIAIKITQKHLNKPHVKKRALK